MPDDSDYWTTTAHAVLACLLLFRRVSIEAVIMFIFVMIVVSKHT